MERTPRSRGETVTYSAEEIGWKLRNSIFLGIVVAPAASFNWDEIQPERAPMGARLRFAMPTTCRGLLPRLQQAKQLFLVTYGGYGGDEGYS